MKCKHFVFLWKTTTWDYIKWLSSLPEDFHE
jgi:hypothetical protein